MEYTGKCIYCGQNQIVVAGDGLNEEEVNKLATYQCNCIEAKVIQKVEEKKNTAEMNIKKLYENDSLELRRLLIYSLPMLAKRTVRKITIQTEDGTKAVLTGKENSIKCDRIVTEKSSLED